MPFGQERALEAIRFGADMKADGYNVFVVGPPGTGRRRLVLDVLCARAKDAATPGDWLYVNNFADPRRPRALALPAGMGSSLQTDMAGLVDRLRVLLPAAFESLEFKRRLEAMHNEIEERQEKIFEEIRARAAERGIAVVKTPVSVGLGVIREDKIVPLEAVADVTAEERERLRLELSRVEEELRDMIRHLPQLQQEEHERSTALHRSVALATLEAQVGELRSRYAGLPRVLEHLDAVTKDILENVGAFVEAAKPRGEPGIPGALRRLFSDEPFFQRYECNIVVRNQPGSGAPVVSEPRPSHDRLVGRVEHEPQLGSLVTNFTMIKPGALHQANGGYLIIEAEKILAQPYAWADLKRCLHTKEVRVESLAEMLSLVSTVSLDPEPIPLDVKVVLIGDRTAFYLLAALDPEIFELVKVQAELEEHVDRKTETELACAQLVAGVVQAEKLRPFDAGAVARVIDTCARRAGDAEKLSANVRALSDLIREADFCAAREGQGTVLRSHVDAARQAQRRRADSLEREVQEEIRRGFRFIDTRGARVGQVNGLSTVEAGALTFAFPARISARVHVGAGEVIDIERVIELGGPIHSKGVLILSAFLSSRYCAELPLALSASIVFEQSYSPVEGDSASAAELFALLSALGDLPVRQGIAVTGSVNQHGQIQPIGSVNEKVEGFFETCKAAGLTGQEGVMIPRANVKNLMLSDDVVAAAQAGMFHVYAIDSVDEGIALLTGVPAGLPDEQGEVPEGTVNFFVAARLAYFAEVAREYVQREAPGGANAPTPATPATPASPGEPR